MNRGSDYRVKKRGVMSNESKKNEQFPDKGAATFEKDEDYSFYEKVMPDGLKGVPDGIRRGIETLLGDNRIRNIVSEIKLPREIVAHIVSGIDETKQAAVGVVAREVREFLQNTNLADEIAKLLTQISFEVSTQVRFVPSDKAIKKKKKETELQEVATNHTELQEKVQERPLRDSFLPKRRSRPPVPE